MEKVAIGYEMATRWTDPTLCLIYMVPYGLTVVGATGVLANRAFKTVAPFSADLLKGKLPQGESLSKCLLAVGAAAVPVAVTWAAWNGLYHGFSEDKSVDTSKYVTFRDAKMAKYYKHRLIPMVEFYEM